MTEEVKKRVKVNNSDIIRLNSLGLSLGTIAKLLDCHPTTITYRLKTLKIPSADTRRSFMEDILTQLSAEESEWLSNLVSTNYPIKDLVRDLIRNYYKELKNETVP